MEGVHVLIAVHALLAGEVPLVVQVQNIKHFNFNEIKSLDTSLAICEQGCVNGMCSAPNKCTCTAGWIGSSCNQCKKTKLSFSTISSLAYTVPPCINLGP